VRLAVIPARGGSKRIPRKNIREFAGKPMIAHSIERARQSGLFDRVVVSTDDEEIAQVAASFGADVPFRRPAELADDFAGTIPVIAHAITALRELGSEFHAVCCIYPTAPLLRLDDLRQGLALLEAGDWRYVFSATTFPAPIFRSFRVLPDRGLEMFFPEQFKTRSQDLPEALHDAGQFYWGRPQAWLDGSDMFGTSSTVVTIPRWRVQDIDTPDDWERAQVLWRLLQDAETER
jgi:N-acylneuraminate cytidylyltransferase